MRSLLQNYEIDMDILDQAALGLLRDRLEIGQIAQLAFPDCARNQQALEEGMISAIRKGALVSALHIPCRHDTQSQNTNDQNMPGDVLNRLGQRTALLIERLDQFGRIDKFLQSDKLSLFNDKSAALNDCSIANERVRQNPKRDLYWITQVQLRAYFVEQGEWPLPGYPLLRKWLEQTSAQKLAKAPDIRTNELHELIRTVMRGLADEHKQSPKARQVWDYLRKCQQDIDLIQEITADKILWVSSNGIERTLNFSSFKTRFSALKKELFEEIED